MADKDRIRPTEDAQTWCGGRLSAVCSTWRTPWRLLRLVAGVLMTCTAAVPAAAAADVAPPQIHTVAGGGTCTFPAPLPTGVGALPCSEVYATAAPIYLARAVAALPGGGYLYVDFYNRLVREVTPDTVVNTVAGDGSTQDATDGTAAVYSGLDGPVAVAPLPNGGFVITEYNGSIVREVSAGPPGTATIKTIAGTGTPGNSGMTSGPATSVQLNYPSDAEVNPDGSIVVADTGNGYVRLLTPNSSGGYDLSTIAGGGTCNDAVSSCDGMAATQVQLHDPVSVSPVAGKAGAYLVAESGPDDNTIREISPSGTFSTVAGTLGPGGFGGDGGPATAAQLDEPSQVVSSPGGGFLVADTDNERIRSVSPAGLITTVAGDGTPGYEGDGFDATTASLQSPMGVSPTGDGGFLIADANNNVIRQVSIPPTTAISLQNTALGLNGWYIHPVLVTVTGSEGAQSSCELDPPQRPPAFAAMPSGCLWSGSTINLNGTHTLWAASMNALGDVDLPVSLSLKVDITPPTLTCTGSPRFEFGASGARVSAKVIDRVSGPQRPVVSVPVGTGRLGSRSATLGGANRAGVSGFTTCGYTVFPAGLKQVPALTSGFGERAQVTTVKRLAVARVPAGASVNLVCSGHGCLFETATGVTGAKCGPRPCQMHAPPDHEYGIDLAPLLRGAKLAPGATLTISVTQTGTIGRGWRFKFAASRAPTQTPFCVAPGSVVTVHGCGAHR
jgi:hypothetical protein